MRQNVSERVDSRLLRQFALAAYPSYKGRKIKCVECDGCTASGTTVSVTNGTWKLQHFRQHCCHSGVLAC
jgi:hypothetical protein